MANIPKISKVFKNWIGQATNPNRIYRKQNVAPDGTPTDTEEVFSLKDETNYQQKGDSLDATTLNDYTAQLNQYGVDFDNFATVKTGEYNNNAQEKEGFIDQKIQMLNVVTASSTIIQGDIAIPQGIGNWKPTNGSMITMVIPQGMAVLKAIRVQGVDYPVLTVEKERAKDMKEGVAYSFSFAGGNFFTKKGYGSGVVEVGGILITDYDFSDDARYVALPYTLNDPKYTELAKRYPMGTTFTYPAPKAPFKAYLKVLDTALPDGVSFTPKDGSEKFEVNQEYWFKGEPYP